METLKNTGLFLLAAFCISLFMGCAEGNDGSEGKNSDAEKVAAAKKALTIPAETDSDLDLPVILNGVAISWASSDEGVISNEGLITRKQYGAQVTLTATLAFGKAVAVKEFTVTVPDFFKNIDDAIKVHNTKDALKIPAETDHDLDLPVNRGDVTVSWVSSDETVISNDGVVTRQLYDVQAVLTATLTFGSETDTKEFTVTVLAFTTFELAEKAAAAKEALVILAETDRDLDLPLDLNGVAISWVSSDEAVISNDGIVTRQLYDTQATLTATLTLGSAVEAKEFTVAVIAVVEEEAELVQLTHWSIAIGSAQNRITMIYPDENAVFNCKVDNGQITEYPFPYWSDDPLLETLDIKNVNMPSGSTIVWSGVEIDRKTGEILYYVDGAFIEIVVKSEENIRGYTVIEAFRNTSSFPPIILKSVIFPQIDGKYQNISDEFVTTAIEKIKAEATGD